jgi:hypothetical protein
MNSLIIIALIVATLGALAALGTGLAVMVRGKDVSGKTSNKWMWRRIYFQAAALALLALIWVLK